MIGKKGVIVPLAMLPVGKNAVIVNVVGGEGIRRRLTELGLSRGAVIRVIKKDIGPLIIALDESRMVLGFGMAQKIMVEEI
ncbi:ferrous iron transport protein A [Thermoanaerobacter uzonensis DSM 18761]|uniref:Ferrous iron transport protein A n=1 Tax=Thermoanaerobacter uzonensis DSM 18761 TaxID=1123369 RepID=A0A1M4V8I7_9THEO|nr:FeoA family protein [Thermoanaerobacter uzonensis]SHE65242.1 ferrous iron transport protein A [Thermoanaerobacter uzonensis DSM 18761]